VKISFFGYNAFLIESGDKIIAIDPGGLFFYFFRFTTLIPGSEWSRITHILVTHGDPDHYWHADRVAAASNAPVICNKTMIKNINGKSLLLGPRDKGLAFTTSVNNLHTLSVGDVIELDGLSIRGIKTAHGQLKLKFGPFSKILTPGPRERVGWGAIGFEIRLDDKCLVNLGDTLLQQEEWKQINEPDVLMIPIGGKVIHNTMDEKEALQAVEIMQPRLVIPCHYNCPAFFTTKYNPADDQMFKIEVEKLGSKCVLLGRGSSLSLN